MTSHTIIKKIPLLQHFPPFQRGVSLRQQEVTSALNKTNFKYS